MKRLKTYKNGRMPLWQKDFDWLQDSYTEIISGIVAALELQDEYFIIDGCKITTELNDTGRSQIKVDSGLIYYNGEILRLQAGSFDNPDPGKDTTIYVEVNTVYDPAGDKQYIMSEGVSDTDIKRTYEERVLIARVMEPNISYPKVFWFKPGAWTLAQRIKKHICDESKWNTTDTNINALFYKQIGKIVYLRGRVFNDAMGGHDGVYGKVPKPEGGHALQLTSEVKVNGNGDLVITSGNPRVYVDGLSYVADNLYIDNNSRQGFSGTQTGI